MQVTHLQEARDHLLALCRQQLLKKQNNRIHYNWEQQARLEQKPPPGSWRIWLILAGRGFGKTRTGAETLRQWVSHNTCKNIALVAATEHEAPAHYDPWAQWASCGTPSWRTTGF